MYRRLLLLPLLLMPLGIRSQHTVSGTITDHATGETLIGATVLDTHSGKGTTTNANGRYTLTLKGDDAILRITFVGYEPIYDTLSLTRNQTRNYNLKPSIQLQEVVVRAQRLGSRESAQMSAIEMPVEQLKAVPVLFGEADIMKAIQLLPGVQSGSEGTGGMYVRGGGPDENLFLLDGIPLYNVNHLGGFFSAFNADAVKNVTLYKGSFPARFGGRLSSVVEVTTNNGNDKEIHGNASIGFVSAKLNVEGPIVKEKTTFCLSARRTYADMLLRPLVQRLATDVDGKSKLVAGYYFYDLNAKVTHTFSDRSRLYATFYHGDDDVYTKVRTESSLAEDQYLDFANNWGNMVGGLRWNYVIAPKLFMNLSASYTQYRNRMKVGIEKVAILDDGSEQVSTISGDYVSSIYDLTGRADFSYSPTPDHSIQFGSYYTRHWIRPTVASGSIDYFDQIQMNNAWQMDTTLNEETVRAGEVVLFIEDDWNINDVLKLNYGVNVSGFEVEEVFYPSVQPRVSGRALIGENLSLKVGYAYMSQYMHLLSTTSISLPTDLWVPSTRRIPPMTAHQVAAGLCYNTDIGVDLSMEGYYKQMGNLIEYRDGATSFGTTAGWEDLVCLGDGWTYGIELLAQRNYGDLTGWAAYTWSRTTHLFNRPGQELNNGNPFPAKYDRRHDLSIVLTYKINKKIDISGTWVFSTGNTATLAMEKYPVASDDPESYNGTPNMGNTLSHVSSRNNFRMPNYHRADISINFHRTFKRDRSSDEAGTSVWRPKIRRTFNISVYNLYNRANPYLTYTSNQYSYQGYDKALVQLSIFPILPSIAYTLYF
ncbi:MAG: TonB-dependent receptor [Bacteroidales bacterium]|nr:TonB-dependent receptor [Bacteroidales bacterium]